MSSNVVSVVSVPRLASVGKVTQMRVVVSEWTKLHSLRSTRWSLAVAVILTAGLDVEIGVFSGGAKALQAMLGGSADIVAGAYSNTITMAAKGQKLVSFVTLASCPGWVFGVTRASHDKVKTYADLKGKRIGVSSPGSSFHMGVNYLLNRAGLKPGDVSIIGVGSSAGAIAAARSGQIDALMSNDPVATVLQGSGDLFPLATTRSRPCCRAVAIFFRWP